MYDRTTLTPVMARNRKCSAKSALRINGDPSQSCYILQRLSRKRMFCSVCAGLGCVQLQPFESPTHESPIDHYNHLRRLTERLITLRSPVCSECQTNIDTLSVWISPYILQWPGPHRIRCYFIAMKCAVPFCAIDCLQSHSLFIVSYFFCQWVTETTMDAEQMEDERQMLIEYLDSLDDVSLPLAALW